MELTGPSNRIDLSGGGSSVTITGGSVTAGSIVPAPTNGTDPVYAVTVEGAESGAVGDLLLKKGEAVYSYGFPACTTTDGKLTLYLPEGEYSGMAVAGGRLVSFTCTASGGAENQSTATDMGIPITTPEGEKPTVNVDRTVDVPAGSAVQTGDGPEITVDGKGGTVGVDGSITVPEGGVVPEGGSTITLPTGGSAVSPTVVTFGERVMKPTDPTRNGYTFDDWYRENNFTTAWNFDTDTVTEDITFYAKWTETSNPGGSSGGGGGYTPPTYKPVETPWNNPFADVDEGDWYYEAVRFVQERGLMNGYSDGRFGANDTLSRAQLAQILFNKEGRPGVDYLLDFSDVADGA